MSCKPSRLDRRLPVPRIIRPAYTTRMKSVADDLRESLRERLGALSPDQRVALTARLAASDLDLFCAAQHMAADVARRYLARERQAGRRPSRVMREAVE